MENKKNISELQKTTVSIIAAVAKNGAIGYKNKLIYWLPDDLKRFKALTSGHTIIMGRNTFDSLPKGALPNRRNIVLSKTVKELPGCDCYESLDEAINHCKSDEEVFVIGGASVYEQALPMADKLYLTEIDDTPENADTFFPDYTGWHLQQRVCHDKDDRHAFAFCFSDYIKP